MRANFEIYTKADIAGAFSDYMKHVLRCEGTTYVEFADDIEHASKDAVSREIITAVREAMDE